MATANRIETRVFRRNEITIQSTLLSCPPWPCGAFQRGERDRGVFCDVMKKDNEPTVYFRLPVRSGYEISRDGDRILIRQLDMADSEISIEIGDFDRILVALEQLHDKLRKEGAL